MHLILPRLRRTSSSLVLLAAGALLLSSLVACQKGPEGGKPLRRTKQRVFVIGLRRHGPDAGPQVHGRGQAAEPEGARRARATSARSARRSPRSRPTAWSSFATGVNPGKHNIYDFLIRDFATYLPDFNMIKKEPPEFLWGLIPTKPPEGHLDARRHVVLGARRGTTASRASSLTVPVTFPPEEIAPRPDARRACRCPTSAARSARSTTGPPTSRSFEEGNTEFGGFLKRLLLRRRRRRDDAARAREPDPQAGGGGAHARRRRRARSPTTGAGAARRARDRQGHQRADEACAGPRARAQAEHRDPGHRSSTSRPASGAPGCRSPSSSTCS